MENVHNEITIIYKINKGKNNIKLFEKKFIENNKNKCKFIYKNKEYDLQEYLNIDNLNKEKIEIKLINIKNITNMNNMFRDCSSLLSLPDISKLNINNITDISYMFYCCSSLSSLPDISKSI